MPKPLKELLNFLKPFPKDVQDNALWLREFVWKQFPKCNELIYDNYNALAIGFGPTDRASDAFCSIAIYSKYINFGLLRGSEIDDPKKMLAGKGSLYRSIKITDIENFPSAYIKKLLKAAYINSISRLKNKSSINGQMIVKSVSGKKRRPS